MLSRCPAGTDDHFPEIRNDRPEITLFSWATDRGWSYEVFPAAEFDAFLLHFYPEMSPITTLSALETALIKVPKDSVIAWRTWPPLKLTYPPPEMVNRIQKFAKSKGLDLQIAPSFH